jgi:GNAT superfamily N-acetyltransferase
MLRIFRHFKGGLYIVKDVVRHSESLDDHILYRPLGSDRWWIRPKAMFEENEPGGKKRFAPLTVATSIRESWNEEDLHEIAALSDGVLRPLSSADLRQRLDETSAVTIATARIDEGPLLGFKIGFALDTSTYYSWLGMVAPAWRGCGIARQLLESQHAWAKARGYQQIETRTLTSFPEMLALNLKMGFAWTRLTDDLLPKIVLTKKL